MLLYNSLDERKILILSVFEFDDPMLFNLSWEKIDLLVSIILFNRSIRPILIHLLYVH